MPVVVLELVEAPRRSRRPARRSRRTSIRGSRPPRSCSHRTAFTASSADQREAISLHRGPSASRRPNSWRTSSQQNLDIDAHHQIWLVARACSAPHVRRCQRRLSAQAPEASPLRSSRWVEQACRLRRVRGACQRVLRDVDAARVSNLCGSADTRPCRSCFLSRHSAIKRPGLRLHPLSSRTSPGFKRAFAVDHQHRS